MRASAAGDRLRIGRRRRARRRSTMSRPDLHLPGVHLPEVHVPDVQLPEVRLRDVHVPDVHLADLRARDPELADTAVEALGGTPRRVRRGPSVGRRLPPPLRQYVTRFDRRVDRSFDAVRGRPAFDKLFYAASELGDFALVWHLLGVAKGLRSDRDVNGAVRLSVALGIESALVNGLVKSLFRRTRPAWDQHRPRALRRPRTSSFPSGHASSGFMAARLLADGDPGWRTAYAVAAVVAASRIHVRIHHASDVVAGAALGLVLGTAARRLSPLPPPPSRGRALAP